MGKIKKYSFLSLMIILFAVIVFQYTTASFTTKPSDDIYLMSEEECTISYGLMDVFGNIETNIVYSLNESEPFKRSIVINNKLGRAYDFSIIAFVNYEQESFYYQEQKELIHTVRIDNNQELIIPIEIDTFDKGYNDLIFLIVPDPAVHERTDEERFIAYQPAYLRCTLFYINQDMPSIPQRKYVASETNDESYFVINHDDNSSHNYATFVQKANETSQLFINVGHANGLNHAQSSVLILMKNLQQVPIAENPYIMLQLETESKLSVPYTIENVEQGYNEYLALQINRPFEIIETYGEVEDVLFSPYFGIKGEL